MEAADRLILGRVNYKPRPMKTRAETLSQPLYVLLGPRVPPRIRRDLSENTPLYESNQRSNM